MITAGFLVTQITATLNYVALFCIHAHPNFHKRGESTSFLRRRVSVDATSDRSSLPSQTRSTHTHKAHSRTRQNVMAMQRAYSMKEAPKRPKINLKRWDGGCKQLLEAKKFSTVQWETIVKRRCINCAQLFQAIARGRPKYSGKDATLVASKSYAKMRPADGNGRNQNKDAAKAALSIKAQSRKDATSVARRS